MNEKGNGKITGMEDKAVHRKKQRKLIGFLVVLLILVSLFLTNLCRQNSSADYSDKRIRANLSAIATFDYSKVSTIESEIQDLERTEAKGTFDVTKKLKKEQYQKIFSTSIILGDSLTEGLVAYGWLGSDQVFCQIGGSILRNEELFDSAAQLYPRNAFLAFGINDIGNFNGSADSFVEKYAELIKAFQKTSPDTRIMVNAIAPPSEAAIDKKPILGKYKSFNTALKKMCKELKLTYIDNSYIFEEHPEYYAADGIHANADYYPYWMNNMILKAGL